MKKCIQILLLSILPGLSHAQSVPDSISARTKSIEAKSSKILDSIKSLASINRFRDSLTINTWSESLRTKINKRFSPDILNRYSDSLRSAGIPEPEIASHSDSLLMRKTVLLKEVEEKQNSLQRKVSARYTGWTESLRKKFNLDSAGVALPAANIPTTPVSSFHASGVPSIPDADLPAPIPSLGTEDFSSLGVTPELADVGGSLTIPSAPQLGEWQKSMPSPAFVKHYGGQSMPEPVEELSKQVAGIKELAANPPDGYREDALEKGVTQLAEVNDATAQLSEADNRKEQVYALKQAEQLKDPEAIKEQAVDHFAGKEAELQATMSQMAKYKRKYSSIGSLSQIPKKDWLPRNGLKGKPFKQRFRPGMNLGYRAAGDTLLFDLYPNAAYRITGRIEAGLGGIYRLRISGDPFGFDQHNPVWGVAMFTVVRTFKSVFIRFETDGTSHVKSGNGEQPSYRDWRWSFYIGIQTNFKVSKRFTGNVQMMYNFDSSLKDGFPEKLNTRIGVQYKLK